MDIIARIAESKIREAMENGEFDNLPGSGKPLQLEDLSRIPEEYRAAYIVLKNAGFLPEELQIKKEIYALRQLINACSSDDEKDLLKKELLEMDLKYNLLLERRVRGIRRLRKTR
ncbi:MAG: DUF1992 domain-containing protein [Actinomycetota bacterium]|nr:DUF1992 domain-containing protein [Actinomycetota bacterium]